MYILCIHYICVNIISVSAHIYILFFSLQYLFFNFISVILLSMKFWVILFTQKNKYIYMCIYVYGNLIEYNDTYCFYNVYKQYNFM